MINGIVYLLCTLTSFACAVLLLRAYGQSRVRLLLWSGLFFIGMTLNNGLLFVGKQVYPAADLSLARNLPAFVGIVCLLYGLIWEEALAPAPQEKRRGG